MLDGLGALGWFVVLLYLHSRWLLRDLKRPTHKKEGQWWSD